MTDNQLVELWSEYVENCRDIARDARLASCVAGRIAHWPLSRGERPAVNRQSRACDADRAESSDLTASTVSTWV